MGSCRFQDRAPNCQCPKPLNAAHLLRACILIATITTVRTNSTITITTPIMQACCPRQIKVPGCDLQGSPRDPQAPRQGGGSSQIRLLMLNVCMTLAFSEPFRALETKAQAT